jgi:hypothetical protein
MSQLSLRHKDGRNATSGVLRAFRSATKPARFVRSLLSRPEAGITPGKYGPEDIVTSPEGTAELSPRCQPISANLFWMFSSNFPQNRHPERSASQIYRHNKGVYSAESKDLEGAYPPDEVRSFSTMMPEYRICISCRRPKGKTVAGPPDAASVVKSSERHG